MEKGWDATGRLKPLWERVGGRDALAQLTGIKGQTLSAYNTGPDEGGRRLGIRNGERIASALEVSVYELGAPRPAASLFASSLLGQIVEEIERHPPQDPDLLRELADELQNLADRMAAAAATAEGRGAATPPS